MAERKEKYTDAPDLLYKKGIAGGWIFLAIGIE